MSDRAASPLPSVDFPPAQSTTTSAPAAPMDDEYNPADPAPRDRDRSPSRRERSRSRERERGERRRSPSYEKEERDHDRDGRSRKDDRYESGDRHRESRHRSRSRSRSRSPARRSSYRHRSDSPDRNRDRDARDRDYHPAASSYRSSHAQSSYAPPRSLGGPMNAPAEEAAAHAAVSVRENRVYVGNLSYDVKYRDLEKFMTDAGLGVAFTEILVTPQGMSKGCGIVELSSREDAQRAITEFTDKTLLGRAIFIREDREPEARFGAPPSAGRGAFAGGVGAAGGFAGGVMGGAGTGQIRQIYVGNLPYQANWQDLKDLFRPAGAIIRADIQMAPDGRPKGSGTVVYETSEDAQNAIAQFNGMEWFGRRLEVREDRYAAFGGGRGGMRGGFRGGMMGGGGMMRGGFMGGARGGFAGGFAGGMGGYGAAAGAMGGMGMGMGGYPVGPAAMGGAGGGYVARPGTESKQIIVNNLPWSTSNEDLVELFETTGDVVSAEILFDASGRSRGSGIVEFVAVDQATTAIAKFTGYVYGGRPLEIRYSPRNHVFSETAGRPGVGMDTA